MPSPLPTLFLALSLHGAPAKPAPMTDTEKEFYAMGQNIGRSLEGGDITPAEADMIARGLHDQITHAPPRCDPMEWMVPAQKMIRERQTSKAKHKAQAQREKDAHGVADALKLPKAQKLPNGAVYVEEVAGTGASPTAADTVYLNYTGKLLDGTEFDSSKASSRTRYTLKDVIPCWTAGVPMMKVGGKAKLVCPDDTAYGDKGHGDKLPGGATLSFELELLRIEKP